MLIRRLVLAHYKRLRKACSVKNGSVEALIKEGWDSKSCILCKIYKDDDCTALKGLITCPVAKRTKKIILERILNPSLTEDERRYTYPDSNKKSGVSHITWIGCNNTPWVKMDKLIRMYISQYDFDDTQTHNRLNVRLVDVLFAIDDEEVYLKDIEYDDKADALFGIIQDILLVLTLLRIRR